MPAGLILRNNSNELVFSSDAFTYGYVGQAFLMGSVQPPTSIPSGGVAEEGYYQYGINWNGESIMVGVPLTTSAASATGVIDIERPNGWSWIIRVRRGDGGALNPIGFRNEAAPTAVHVWGIPYGDPGYGLIIRAPDGSLRADLSRRPLDIRARVLFSAGSTGSSMAAVTSPLILTAAGGGRLTNTGYPGVGDGVIDRALWWLDGTVLRRVLVQRQRYAGEDGPSQPASYPAQVALVTTSTGL